MLFSVGFFCFYFILFGVLLGLWVFRKKKPAYSLSSFPKVSILIAARNEEANILACLAAIERLNYPKDRLEVLVGDDRSSDATFTLVQSLLPQRPYLTCVSITDNLPGTKGKANVLAQLAQKATSDFFFITDADIEVPPQWLTSLMGQVKQGTGIVTGITTTKGSKLFDRMQALDWLFSLGLMQVVADRGVPVSTMGNNMLITREAYEAVGGFAGIPFSITEDVQIFKEVIKKGFTTANVYEAEVLALSMPAPDFSTFLQQRRRWMRGSVSLPWYMLLLFVIHSSYYPIWLPFFLHTTWVAALLVFLVKLTLQSVFVWVCAKRVNWKTNVRDLIFFELYLLSTSLILIVYFFIPLRIRWKGRQY
ncbi:glycosyltransferase [Rufibacter roseus]|uniref:Glycosyltransferase n=1 Tax=Rufibacter roseus TaxID=1567108 RepID=A0ABW2DS88_9BACT|nr:glycosyltransferase [Rufibacter roseus]